MSGYSIKVPARKIVEIRRIANQIRETFKVKQPYFNIMKFIEFVLPEIDPDFTLDILSREDMGDNHGLTYPDQNLIYLREDIYEGAMAGNGRDRMTVAHELGHKLLHKNVPLFARKMTNNEKIKTFEDSEWQAKCFAGELLVPHSDKSLHHLSEAEIAEKCGVSLDAARIQKNRMKN